jgi:hypothetical protein
MSYYPKSQIQTNLYSKGEWTLNPNSLPYIGPYYKISNGQAFTGKYPGDGFNEPLELSPNVTLLNQTYINIDSIGLPSPEKIIPSPPNAFTQALLQPQPPSRTKPTYTPTLPTPNDYIQGYLMRYFAKKNNEPYFIEINQEQHLKFYEKNPLVAFDLYSTLKILWKIKGNSDEVYNSNKNNISLIENSTKWWGFTQYFKDNFTKYLK